MPTKRTYIGKDNFVVNIKFQGCRRLFEFIPHLSGKTIKFKISLKDKANIPIPYEWRLSARYGSETWWQKGKKDNPIKGEISVGKRDQIIDLGFPFRTGDYSFQMRWKDEIANNSDFQDMVYFYVDNYDVFITKSIQVLLGGIVGGIVVALISRGCCG